MNSTAVKIFMHMLLKKNSSISTTFENFETEVTIPIKGYDPNEDITFLSTVKIRADALTITISPNVVDET